MRLGLWGKDSLLYKKENREPREWRKAVFPGSKVTSAVTGRSRGQAWKPVDFRSATMPLEAWPGGNKHTLSSGVSDPKVMPNKKRNRGAASGWQGAGGWLRALDCQHDTLPRLLSGLMSLSDS